MTYEAGECWRLNLLGMWELSRDERRVHVASRQQRLIAALALLPPRPRVALAGTLWPDSSERHASGNLRAALCRIRHELPGLLEPGDEPLALSSRIRTDVTAYRERVDRIGTPGWSFDAGLLDTLRTVELLPGWYDDWICIEQERFRQQRMRSLHALIRALLTLGESSRALEAAQVAVLADPLDESSQSLLIEAQISSGNHAGAARQLNRFEALVETELGVQPSSRIRRLVEVGAVRDRVARSSS
ncbi:AfsR/SARP family transcriptional regulator [Agromyces binzhouensis]|uniref:AfsR/SARP family transcriptional regulator n=1 Tax=Agromyces binzhouensis TaxID=1817495 RepID=UPI00362E9E38